MCLNLNHSFISDDRSSWEAKLEMYFLGFWGRSACHRALLSFGRPSVLGCFEMFWVSGMLLCHPLVHQTLYWAFFDINQSLFGYHILEYVWTIPISSHITVFLKLGHTPTKINFKAFSPAFSIDYRTVPHFLTHQWCFGKVRVEAALVAFKCIALPETRLQDVLCFPAFCLGESWHPPFIY